MRVSERVAAKLDAAVKDPLLVEHLVELQTAVPLGEAAVERFRTALADGATAPDRFALLMMGSVTQPIPGPVLAQFLRELFALDDGVLPALQVLHMRIFGDRSVKPKVDPALIELGRDMLADPKIYTSEL